MKSSVQQFEEYRGKLVLLDSNLLLLYLIGTYQRSLIRNFKRTSQYTEAEFEALVVLLSQFGDVLTTPHLLTEVNDLANSLPGYLRSDLLHTLLKAQALRRGSDPFG